METVFYIECLLAILAVWAVTRLLNRKVFCWLEPECRIAYYPGEIAKIALILSVPLAIIIAVYVAVMGNAVAKSQFLFGLLSLGIGIVVFSLIRSWYHLFGGLGEWYFPLRTKIGDSLQIAQGFGIALNLFVGIAISGTCYYYR